MNRLPSSLILTTLLLSATLAHADWTLQPITGHQPDFWKAQPNWNWDQKNPREEGGAKWSLAVQPQKEPALDAPYTLLQPSKAYGYFYVWSSGDNKQDPEYSYRDFILATRPLDGTPQSGPAVALKLAVPEDGKYALDFKGTINVQSPTAGHARVTAYTISAGGTNATKLESWDVNADKPNAFGKFPSQVSFQKEVVLKKGDELAVRIQTINPGPASAGTSSLTFTNFTVKPIKG